jgi:hypothetical protein
VIWRDQYRRLAPWWWRLVCNSLARRLSAHL